MNNRLVLAVTAALVCIAVVFSINPAGASAPNSYVKLQNATPGASQPGHMSVSGNGLFGGLVGIGTTDPQALLDISVPGTELRGVWSRVDDPASSQTALFGQVASIGNGAAVRGQAYGSSGTPIGVFGRSFAPDSIAINGENFAQSGNGYGVKGISYSPTGIGVFGNAYLTSGANRGVYGLSSGAGGSGVYGSATSGTGATHGVYGHSVSSVGFGVYGANQAGPYGYLGGATAGVYGAHSNGSYGILGGVNNGLQAANANGNIGYVGTDEHGVYGLNTNGNNGRLAGPSYGAYGSTGLSSGDGVLGLASSTTGATFGVRGQSDSTSGVGVFGYASATSGNGDGVRGETMSTSGRGVIGVAYATSGTTDGVNGTNDSTDGRGVFGYARSATGNTRGVIGQADSIWGTAVRGETIYIATNNPSTSGGRFYGDNYLAVGVFGAAGAGGFGVHGAIPSGGSGYAMFADGRTAATGTKSFRIDHPLDPENKYLLHYSAEGPEPMNVYSGNVTTDEKGEAWVALPTYCEEINKDFRYTLTVVDNTDSDVFVMAKVARKVQGNQFKIRTNAPHIEVTWRVEGVRNDLWVRAYGAPVEVEKEPWERGKYQHPELYGKPQTMGYRYDLDMERVAKVSAKQR